MIKNIFRYFFLFIIHIHRFLFLLPVVVYHRSKWFVKHYFFSHYVSVSLIAWN